LTVGNGWFPHIAYSRQLTGPSCLGTYWNGGPTYYMQFTDTGEIHMSKEDAIRKLIDVAKKNYGQPTNEELARKDAVNYLAGRPQEHQPLRPEADALIRSIRRNQ
jgi:hypothetical protein